MNTRQKKKQFKKVHGEYPRKKRMRSVRTALQEITSAHS